MLAAAKSVQFFLSHLAACVYESVLFSVRVEVFHHEKSEEKSKHFDPSAREEVWTNLKCSCSTNIIFVLCYFV